MARTASATPKLRKYRLRYGLSQNQLARQSDLDRGTVSRAERGFEIQPETAQKLFNALRDAAPKNESGGLRFEEFFVSEPDPIDPWP